MSHAFQANWFDTVALAPHLKAMIQTAKDSLIRDRKSVTDSRLVAELNMGFWLGLLTKRYETTLWIPHLRHAFPRHPNPFTRQLTYECVDRIRNLRNRIAHHEPIFERTLPNDYDAILALVDWICNDTAGWIQRNSRFHQVWANRP
jgi:hypothetical protein